MVARKATADVPSYAESRGRAYAQELCRMVGVRPSARQVLDRKMSAPKTTILSAMPLKSLSDLADAKAKLAVSSPIDDEPNKKSAPACGAL